MAGEALNVNLGDGAKALASVPREAGMNRQLTIRCLATPRVPLWR